MILSEEQLNKIIEFIKETCDKFNIDSGHGLDHSITILNYCHAMIPYYNLSETQQLTIELASLLHDMCDKKYMNESDGIVRIEDFLLKDMRLPKIVVGDIETIILKMSYSKVVKNGYPDFTHIKYLEIPYHIVRNADLLCAYELERCMEYQKRCGGDNKECLEKMMDIYQHRISKHFSDGLINLEPAVKIGRQLELKCREDYEKYVLDYVNNYYDGVDDEDIGYNTDG
jgi:hypothetical protein